MKFYIYQPERPTFRVDKTKKVYNKGEYHLVYSESIKNYCGNPGIEHKVLLEMLFMDFNREWKPRDYKGHSLSVGDIVVIDKFAYICDNFGWKEITFTSGVINPPKCDNLNELAFNNID